MSKKEWGQATWYLFHTLAEKIDEEYYIKNKAEFFRIVGLICSNLPCPECSKHSTEILRRLNIESIKSRDELIKFFFDFHNHVNISVKKASYKKEALVLYKKANIANIIQNFLDKFFVKFYNEKLLMHSFNRSGIKNNLTTYLTQRIVFA